MNSGNLGEELSKVAASISAVTEECRKQFQAFFDVQRKALEELRQAWLERQQEWEPILKGFAEAFQKLPERTRVALEILGQNGWYLDETMTASQLIEIVNTFQHGNQQAANEALCHFYQEHLGPTQQFLIKKYPRRSYLLQSAFEAHESGKYELAIPVFLSQTDGICQDLLKLSPFSRREGRPAIAEHIEKLESNSLTAAFLHPFAIPLPISASTTERARNPNELNRHAVIHGESVDYGTKVNSYKAISLLYYVASVLDQPADNK